MDIEVASHGEREIQTAIVVIKAMVERGAIDTPLLAAISPEHGWRAAAIKYLDMVKERRQKGLPLRANAVKGLTRDEANCQELNERWDWEERKNNGGVTDRERAANA